MVSVPAELTIAECAGPMRYVRCPDGCQRGLIIAYRHDEPGCTHVAAMFVCETCKGHGTVPQAAAKRIEVSA